MKRRRALARMSTTACSPGASVTISGSKLKPTLPSGSSPASRPAIIVLPVFSASTLKLARLPAVTATGSTLTCIALAAGTVRSISVIELSSGGVSSRTCTAIRRMPAGMPGGGVIVIGTTWTSSGNSETCSLSICTQPGSAPSMRTW